MAYEENELGNSDSDDDIEYIGTRPGPRRTEITEQQAEGDINVEQVEQSDVTLQVPKTSPQRAPERKIETGDKGRRHQAKGPTGKRSVRILGDPYKVRKGLVIGRDGEREQGQEARYASVDFGGQVISIDVMVICKHTDKAGITVDSRGLVRYISVQRYHTSKEKEKVRCHVHWISHSPCGQPGELFLKHGSCDDISLGSIVKMETVSVDHQESEGAYIRHVHHASHNVWRDIKRLDEDNQPTCDSCISRTPKPRPAYHVYDSILLDDSKVVKNGTLVWTVARIVRISGQLCWVQPFERYSTWAARQKGLTDVYVSEKRLILTKDERKIDMGDIIDKAFIVSISQELDQLPPDRSFFCDIRFDTKGDLVPLLRPLTNCQSCLSAAQESEVSYADFCRLTSLPAIDYYSGGGGGIIGASDFFDHRHAVEMDFHACKTLRHNFPEMKIHCSRVRELSEATLEGRRVRREFDGQPVSRLPKPGSMALALAGPPCQGHSGANHHNKLDDPRNNELFVIIDEIKRLQPDIFILENVPGMKSDKDIINREESRNFAIAAIKSIRKIGYQCRLTLFDSRSFGSPQNRLRLFIICARRGVLLPSNPEPSHTNPAITINLFTSADMEQQPRAFFVGTKGVQGSAPYPAVTVRDAISDLPPFEYEHRQPVVSARSVPRFDASGQPGDRVGFDGAVEHASGAKNDYQTSQRRGATQVFDHYTPARSARLLGLVVAATALVGQSIQGEEPGNCRRINPDRGATTLLTDSAPGGMYTGAIHWDQRRTLTVAERKRIQGVPDTYVLHGTVQQQDRMLGNMINVHMSRALHGHIHREVFFPAWLKMGKPSNFFDKWRQSHPI